MRCSQDCRIPKNLYRTVSTALWVCARSSFSCWDSRLVWEIGEQLPVAADFNQVGRIELDEGFRSPSNPDVRPNHDKWTKIFIKSFSSAPMCLSILVSCTMLCRGSQQIVWQVFVILFAALSFVQVIFMGYCDPGVVAPSEEPDPVIAALLKVHLRCAAAVARRDMRAVTVNGSKN